MAIEAALALAKEALEVEVARAGLPQLGGLSAAGEASLRQLALLDLPEGLLAESPGSLAARLPARAKLSNGQASAIAKILPVLSAIGFDGSMPFGVVRALAAAIASMPEISAERLQWYAVSGIDAAAFPAIHARWNELLREEKLLRARYPGSANQQWPDGPSLRAAAAEAAQTGIGRFIPILGRVKKALLKACGELGIKSGDASHAALAALAGHVEALVAFEGDDRARAALGTAWAGLNSRFDAISEGLAQLQALRHRLSGSREGPAVATRLQAIVLSKPQSLGDFHIAFAGFEGAFADIGASADLRPASEVHGACREEIAALKTIVDAGFAKDVAALNAPFRQLFGALTQADRFVKLRQQLEASEEGRRVASLVRHPADIGTVASAAKWLDRLRGCELPDVLRRRLASADAQEARRELGQIAGAARGLLDRKTEAAGKIASCRFMNVDTLDLADLRSKLSPLLAARASAWDFLQLRRVQKPLRDCGLEAFIEQAETLRIPYERLENSLRAVLAFHQANQAIRGTKELSVSGPQIEARRSQFAQRDREKLQRDRTALRSRLLKCSPPQGSDSGSRKTWTEFALLRKELRKGKRHEPVRELLMRAGRAMQELKPCFMMSPISLAKFSGDRNLQFDLLVIDEASQMKPEDALGGFLRSKKVIVVGDRKQLPPTDFFSRAAAAPDGDDEQDDVVEESILENCETAFRRVRRLSWHYRSRCESLIRFANKEFYENKLITFPAPVPGSFSIDHARIAGNYRGGRNHAEASEIVEAAIGFIHAHAGSAEVPSLGLVAINSQQRDLIREEFARLSASDGQVSAYLEAVQQKAKSSSSRIWKTCRATKETTSTSR